MLCCFLCDGDATGYKIQTKIWAWSTNIRNILNNVIVLKENYQPHHLLRFIFFPVVTWQLLKGYISVQSNLYIKYQCKPISLQYSWLSVEQPIDWVLYECHWEVPINKKTSFYCWHTLFVQRFATRHNKQTMTGSVLLFNYLLHVYHCLRTTIKADIQIQAGNLYM